MSLHERSPGWRDGDAFYAALVEALDRAGEQESVGLLLRLTLILANEIGDQEVLSKALLDASGADAG